jgi:hypothetical protein
VPILSPDTNLYNFFVIEHNCMKLLHIVLHLENLFFGIGSSELSNKMVLCTIDLKVYVIKISFSFRGSCVAVERQYWREFSIHVAPSRDTVCWIVNRKCVW